MEHCIPFGRRQGNGTNSTHDMGVISIRLYDIIEANIPPNKLVDKPVEASKITVASKSSDVNNPLFGRKSGGVRALAVVPYAPVVIPQVVGLVVDQRQTRTLVDQIVNRMPQLIERDVLAAEKRIKDKMLKELVVLTNRMDVLETHVQTQLQATRSSNNEEFQK
uniref:Integrase core domain containing protein n=1 Tax=Solanum tuberosum TaxID=4113 RepID=M1DFH2_SOLTU